MERKHIYRLHIRYMLFHFRRSIYLVFNDFMGRDLPSQNIVFVQISGSKQANHTNWHDQYQKHNFHSLEEA